MSRKDRDPIEELNEWQEHQYNPGYWVNRFSPHFPPRRSKGIWLMEIFGLIVIVIGFMGAVIAYFTVGPETEIKIFLGIFGVFIVLGIIRVINLKPGSFKDQKSQQETDEIRRREKKEQKKKLPKRRKDYG